MKLVLDETRFTDTNLQKHYPAHVAKDWISYYLDLSEESLEPMSKEEYDAEGDRLSKVKVTTSDYDKAGRYVGFVTEDGRIIKIDKLYNEAVVYISKSPNNSNTISLYGISPSGLEARYERLKKAGYLRDITVDDDKYNV